MVSFCRYSSVNSFLSFNINIMFGGIIMLTHVILVHPFRFLYDNPLYDSTTTYLSILDDHLVSPFLPRTNSVGNQHSSMTLPGRYDSVSLDYMSGGVIWLKRATPRYKVVWENFHLLSLLILIMIRLKSLVNLMSE